MHDGTSNSKGFIRNEDKVSREKKRARRTGGREHQFAARRPGQRARWMKDGRTGRLVGSTSGGSGSPGAPPSTDVGAAARGGLLLGGLAHHNSLGPSPGSNASTPTCGRRDIEVAGTSSA